MSSTPSTLFEKDIVEVLNVMMNVLETQHTRLVQLEGRIVQLAKQPAVIVNVPKNRKLLPFVVGVGIGVYMSTRFNKNLKKVDVLLENANEGAKQRFTPPTNEVDPNTPGV